MSISTQAAMEDFFYHELIKYLALAEKKRRWNQFEDIPWLQANPLTTEELAKCVETFMAVELYLPDFTSKLLVMIRKSRGRAWFHINWGYEESKHSMALELWLLSSGHRSEEQRRIFEETILGEEWELPFDHPRQMLCYTMIQELATFWNYRNLEKFAVDQKDPALTTALRLISVDERVHYNFFRTNVKEWMKHDEAGTVADLKYVFEHFSMPGDAQIPDYMERAKILAKTGIYGPREYVKLVKNPILEDLGLKKDYTKIERQEAKEDEESLERIEKMKREMIVVSGNDYAIPKNSSPLNGISRYNPRHPALLQIAGFKPEVMESLDSLAKVRKEVREQAVPTNGNGSYGMQKLDDLDQRLITIGDELSTNADELRQQRAKHFRGQGPKKGRSQPVG